MRAASLVAAVGSVASLRFILCGVGAAFAALALGFWVAPTDAAQLFQLEAVGTSGLVSMRADLGGLFLGIAVLVLAGAAQSRRPFVIAAALVVGAVATGRGVGLVTGAADSSQLIMFVVELVITALLATYARALGLASATTRRPPARATVLAAGTGLLLAGSAVAAFLNPTVELWIFQRGAAAATSRDTSHLLIDDAMRVVVCGSSAPLPSTARAKACVAVLVGGRLYIVDSGPESVEYLVQAGLPLSQIGGVLFTHFHSDHIGDLGELNLQSWAQGRPAPMRVFGGPGIERVVNGFNEAYRTDQGYRTAHHSARVMPPDTWPMVAYPVALDGPETTTKSRSTIVIDEGDLRVTALEVDHAPIAPAYAYRFDYKGRSVVVSGDLKYHPPLVDGARGADVLVIEAISRSMVQALHDGAVAAERPRQAAIFHDIQDYHIDPAEAADLANQAGVKLLAFYHLLPAPDTFLARRLFGAAVNGVRRGDWTIADDGSLYTLPIGSDEVRIGHLGR